MTERRMVKIMPDMQRIFTKKERKMHLNQLVGYGYLEVDGDKFRLKYTFEELLTRCENNGIKLRPPHPDDDVTTLLACFFSDLVLREKALAKPGDRILKSDFDNLFYGYGQIFYRLLDQNFGAEKLTKSWTNYTKKHLGHIPK
jgi:hypothetical protein